MLATPVMGCCIGTRLRVLSPTFSRPTRCNNPPYLVVGFILYVGVRHERIMFPKHRFDPNLYK